MDDDDSGGMKDGTWRTWKKWPDGGRRVRVPEDPPCRLDHRSPRGFLPPPVFRANLEHNSVLARYWRVSECLLKAPTVRWFDARMIFVDASRFLALMDKILLWS